MLFEQQLHHTEPIPGVETSSWSGSRVNLPAPARDKFRAVFR
jgi:hypothetical protein